MLPSALYIIWPMHLQSLKLPRQNVFSYARVMVIGVGSDLKYKPVQHVQIVT